MKLAIRKIRKTSVTSREISLPEMVACFMALGVALFFTHQKELIMDDNSKLPLYRIKDWDDHFENNRSRKIKQMAWVKVPNKHDGDGYTELITGKNGVENFAAWVLLLQVASKCRSRGTLVREGDVPHTPSSLSRMTRVSPEIFKRAIPVLMQIGWLEELRGIAQAGDVEVTPPAHFNCVEQKEEKEQKEENPPPPFKENPKPIPEPDSELGKYDIVAGEFLQRTGNRTGKKEWVANEFHDACHNDNYRLNTVQDISAAIQTLEPGKTMTAKEFVNKFRNPYLKPGQEKPPRLRSIDEIDPEHLFDV